MRKSIKQLFVGGIVVVGTIIGGGRVSALEIIDEKGEKWADITEAIQRWPLNTFNTMYVSEFDFLNNTVSVIFNGVKTDSETGESIEWSADELLMGWVNYDGLFQRSEFAGLRSFDETDRYTALIHLKFDKPLQSGVEVNVDKLEGNIYDRFYSDRLAYVIRNNDGDATRANYYSAFQCAVQVREGQVCRLFYKDPILEHGASSGQTKYFPVQKTEIVAKSSDGETVAEEKNDSDDIVLMAESLEESENSEKYSSGDIFNEKENDSPLNDIDEVAQDDEKASRLLGVVGKNADSARNTINSVLVAGMTVGNNSGSANGGGVAANDDKENDVEKILGLAEGAEEGNKEIEKIEVPRLGMTTKEIDYKWLFLPVLGLILMVYWWFIAPIWKKSRKNEKKSKKSVDNI